jgi:hypothetical protein
VVEGTTTQHIYQNKKQHKTSSKLQYQIHSPTSKQKAKQQQ